MSNTHKETPAREGYEKNCAEQVERPFPVPTDEETTPSGLEAMVIELLTKVRDVEFLSRKIYEESGGEIIFFALDPLPLECGIEKLGELLYFPVEDKPDRPYRLMRTPCLDIIEPFLFDGVTLPEYEEENDETV